MPLDRVHVDSCRAHLERRFGRGRPAFIKKRVKRAEAGVKKLCSHFKSVMILTNSAVPLFRLFL